MHMLVDFTADPIAVATRTPRFSWEVPLTGRARRQSAYRILVATSPDLLEPGRSDLWDSGHVHSSRSLDLPYEGRRLTSDTDCFWTVRLWDEHGEPVEKNAVAHFGAPLFDAHDWKATWIGMGSPDEPFSDPDSFQQDRVAPDVQAVEPDPRAPLLRTEFSLDKPVRRARVYVCGLGLYELRLNGRKVGSDVLATPRTDFRKRVLYSVYDVAEQLTTGPNALGLILGNGWFNGQKKYWGWQMQWYGSPRAILQLEVEFEDGSRTRVVTDGSWRGDWSPITANCIYDGEHCDARREQDGWDRPGFDGSEWRTVNEVAAPGGRLAPVSHEPSRVTETRRPVSFSEPEPGVFVYDLGTILTGWVRLTLRNGPRGQTVRLRYAELLDDRGMLDCHTSGKARQEDSYITRGGPEESWEPRFTYHGFRYVEIAGCPEAPELDDVDGRFVRTAVAPTGTFECANDLINRIHRCTVQSQMCNVQMGVPTDDTQRPERLGWAGDAWSYACEAYYNLHMPRVFAKWIADFYDQQDEVGMVGMIVPQAGAEEDLVWSAAFVLIPWWQYVHCGDRRILEDSYPYLQRYMQFLEKTGQKDVAAAPTERVIDAIRWRCGKQHRFPAQADRGVLQICQWGDHLAICEGASGARKNQPLCIATAFYYLDLVTMARIAETLGHAQDAQRYRDQAATVKDAFNARFFEDAFGYYDVGCQSAQGWALAFGLVPDEHRQAVSGYLNSSVGYRQRGFTTGYAGTKFAIQAIADSGRHDIVWQRATSPEYPGWAHMLSNGKTAITESWHGGGSQCHTTLGAAIDEWFYYGLAGIRPDETGPGYEKIVFQPYLPADLPWVRASLRTPRGVVRSAWRQESGRVILEVTVPANSSATVHLPCAETGEITEGGAPLKRADGVIAVNITDLETRVDVGSGMYRFEFPAP